MEPYEAESEVESSIPGISEQLRILFRARPVEDAELDARWQGVMAKGPQALAAGPGTSLNHRSPSMIRRWAPRWIAVCGAVAGAILLARFQQRSPQAAASTYTATYTTRPGQRATVTLPNGARVTLAPVTQLIVTGTHVTLSGQALFTVPHREGEPFTVQTGRMVARVLGTTFMVRHYPTDHDTRVVVAEGRIAVRGVVLSARMGSVIDDSGRVAMISRGRIEDDTAWIAGQLVFHNTPIRDVVMELSRAYGAALRVNDSALAILQVTWTLPMQSTPLSEALAELGDMADAHVVRSGRVIVLAPGRTNTPAMGRPVGRPSLTQESQYGK